MSLNKKLILMILFSILGFAVLLYGQTDNTESKPRNSSNEWPQIRPSYPTHYFYTPKAKVNPPWHLVTGLHEISFSFPANLQLFNCLMDNIGRINFGAKYGFNDRFSVAAGLAGNLFHIGRGSHGIPSYRDDVKPRFGSYFCIGIIDVPLIENSVTIHTQVGDHFSFGADYGMQITPHKWWSAIFEVGNSIDFTAHKYSDKNAIWYLNVDMGVRVHPPSIPAFSFDLGIDIEEFPLIEDNDIGVTIFTDVIFAMIVM
jgi:hypothetical protein